MRAVNLIPGDAQRSGSRALKLAPATYAFLGGLVAALVLLTMYVLAQNTVASRQAQVSSLQAQVRQDQAQAAALKSYTQFASAAQSRVQAVRGIAATRFDWHTALANLAKVIPANTSLQKLTGSVVPGANADGSGGGGGSGLRAALPGPAFEMSGCTASQDDVARLISRLRALPGVTRVSLSNSAIDSNLVATAGGSSGGTAPACKVSSPTFSLVVFFAPVAGAGPTGAASLGSGTSSGGAK